MSTPDSDPTFMESKAITTSYGPRNITRNMLQDKNGNLWFASWEGIIRYDGKSFTNFTNKEGLRRFHVFSVFEEEAGNLWFGTIGAGVYRYDGKSFRNFTTQDGLAEDRVLCIAADKSGNIWFGTRRGVSRYNGESFRNFTTKEGLADNGVNTIIEDKNGNLWFGGDDPLCHYDGKSFTKFATNAAGHILEDTKGNIWISGGGTHNMALYRYDGNALSSGQAGFTQVTKRAGQIFGILEDKNGDIWFGTEQGVGRYDGKSFAYF